MYVFQIRAVSYVYERLNFDLKSTGGIEIISGLIFLSATQYDLFYVTRSDEKYESVDYTRRLNA